MRLAWGFKTRKPDDLKIATVSKHEFLCVPSWACLHFLAFCVVLNGVFLKFQMCIFIYLRSYDFSKCACVHFRDFCHGARVASNVLGTFQTARGLHVRVCFEMVRLSFPTFFDMCMCACSGYWNGEFLVSTTLKNACVNFRVLGMVSVSFFSMFQSVPVCVFAFLEMVRVSFTAPSEICMVACSRLLSWRVCRYNKKTAKPKSSMHIFFFRNN